MVRKHAYSKLESKSGYIVLGTNEQFIPLAPGKITLDSTNEFDKELMVSVKGVGLDGEGVSEFVRVGSQSQKSYSYIDELTVTSSSDNKGTITAYDASGGERLSIKPFENRSHICIHYARKPLKIKSWGIGVEGDINLHSVTGLFIVLRKGKRIVVDRMTVTQYMGELHKESDVLELKVGDILLMEVLSDGSEQTVHGYFELIEEQS